MILLLGGLAACADAPPPASLPQQGVKASFPPGGVINLIRVDALDTLPLRAAELVAPDGTATPATYLDAERAPQTTNGQSTLNDPWRTSMLGANGIPQLANGQLAPAVRSRDTLLLTVSAAEIPLPDPVAYRRDWAGYRIRVTFAGIGGAGQPDIREIAAPEPPPG
ncbi:MAG TPA: hypothetical protein VFC56_10050 [Stellaceae bacterium]|nr:hypothetical protein [Stellaceae bacterium]